MNTQNNQELIDYQNTQQAIKNGEKLEVTQMYESLYHRAQAEAKADSNMADSVIEAFEEELNETQKAKQSLQEQLDYAKTIMQKMVDALEDFLSITKRRDNEPMYGRDANNLGVPDGYSTAPDDYEYEAAQSKAREVCYEALEAGLIEKLPYYLY